MKQELINKIMPNCLIPHYLMVVWINALQFQNEPADALRQLIISKLKSNGQLLPEGWELLLNNAIFEYNASITSAQALGWINAQNCPTCNQLTQIIQDLKLNMNYQIMVNMPVLEILEANMTVDADVNIGVNAKSFSTVMQGDNGMEEVQIVSKFFSLQIKNFHYIKDANPYLIIERYTGAKKSTGRKAGWKRDRTLMKSDGAYFNGWENQWYDITEENGFRPNEIAILNSKQVFDINPSSYIMLPIGNKKMPRVVSGNKNKSHNIAENWINGIRQHVYLRLRVGYKIGGIEKISKPLINFSIFAKSEAQKYGYSGKVITISYSKL